MGWRRCGWGMVLGITKKIPPLRRIWKEPPCQNILRDHGHENVRRQNYNEQRPKTLECPQGQMRNFPYRVGSDKSHLEPNAEKGHECHLFSRWGSSWWLLRVVLLGFRWNEPVFQRMIRYDNRLVFKLTCLVEHLHSIIRFHPSLEEFVVLIPKNGHELVGSTTRRSDNLNTKITLVVLTLHDINLLNPLFQHVLLSCFDLVSCKDRQGALGCSEVSKTVLDNSGVTRRSIPCYSVE